jgi:hypothetical protein
LFGGFAGLLALNDFFHVEENDHPLVAIDLADARNILAIDCG